MMGEANFSVKPNACVTYFSAFTFGESACVKQKLDNVSVTSLRGTYQCSIASLSKKNGEKYKNDIMENSSLPETDSSDHPG
jgi:hypothetical protein